MTAASPPLVLAIRCQFRHGDLMEYKALCDPPSSVFFNISNHLLFSFFDTQSHLCAFNQIRSWQPMEFWIVSKRNIRNLVWLNCFASANGIDRFAKAISHSEFNECASLFFVHIFAIEQNKVRITDIFIAKSPKLILVILNDITIVS